MPNKDMLLIKNVINISFFSFLSTEYTLTLDSKHFSLTFYKPIPQQNIKASSHGSMWNWNLIFSKTLIYKTEFNHEKTHIMQYFCQQDILSPSFEAQNREVTR